MRNLEGWFTAYTDISALSLDMLDEERWTERDGQIDSHLGRRETE